jgi:hypothetical protein
MINVELFGQPVFVVGLWLQPADGRGWQLLSAVGALGLIALLPFVRLSRARLARRWQAALDAYAVREIDRDRRHDFSR